MMKRYLEFLKIYVLKYGEEIAICTFLSIMHMLLMLVTPYISQYLIDDILVNSQVHLLNKLLFVFTGFILLSAFIHYMYSMILNKKFLDIGYDLKTSIYGHIRNWDLRDINKYTTGMLNYRIFNDTETIKGSMGKLIFSIVLNVILIIIITVYMTVLHWKLSMIVIGVQLMQIAVIVFYRPSLLTIAAERKKLTEAVTARVVEILGSFKLYKSAANNEHEGKRFEKEIRAVTDMAYKETILMTQSGIFVGLINGIVTISILWYGGNQVINNVLTLGELTAFLLIGNMLSSPISACTSTILGFQGILASTERIFQLLEIKNNHSSEHRLKPSELKGEIILKDVTFQYEGKRKVIDSVNLTLPEKSIVSIVGRSGAGKTTLTYLLGRIYSPASGEVRIGKYNIEDVDVNYYRKNVGLILQDNFLLSGTIRDNILLGNPDATVKEVEEAAKKAHAHEFIKDLPDGYWTEVGERGRKLSGGQAQRIALARIFLQNPVLVILDEVTSFIDIESEELIRESIKKLSQESTVVIITHKLSTAKMASKIVLLDRGRVFEEGNHEEMIHRKGRYYELYRKVLAE